MGQVSRNVSRTRDTHDRQWQSMTEPQLLDFPDTCRGKVVVNKEDKLAAQVIKCRGHVAMTSWLRPETSPRCGWEPLEIVTVHFGVINGSVLRKDPTDSALMAGNRRGPMIKGNMDNRDWAEKKGNTKNRPDQLILADWECINPPQI